MIFNFVLSYAETASKFSCTKLCTKLSGALALVTASSLLGSTALAAPVLNYEGRIYHSDGTPVTSNNVQFKIQIRTPGPENCLLYEEIQTQDLSGSEGNFALAVNSGTGTRTDSSGYDLDRIFANRGLFNFAAGSCTSGTTYVPGSDDGRVLQIAVKDGAMGTWDPMPPVSINSVPFAVESKQVQGFAANSLVRVQEADGTMGNISPLSNASYNELLNLIAGNSSSYARSSSSAGARVPAFSGAPSTPVAGSMWFDSVTNQLMFFNGTTNVTVGAGGGSGISALTGDVLASGAGAVSTTIANNAVTSAKIADGAITNPKLSNDSVNSVNIVDGSIMTPDLAFGIEIRAADGTSTMPSYRFNNSGNTGMFLPAINTIGFATNGFEAVRIAQSGRVGIGTTSPTEMLEVVGWGQFEGIRISQIAFPSCTTLDAGRVKHITSPNRLQFCDGTGWKDLAMDVPAYFNSSSTSINFSNSNVQSTMASCGPFTLNGMRDGQVYSLLIEGMSVGTCSFTHPGLTFLTEGTLSSTISRQTFVRFTVVGTKVVTEFMPGFQ